MSINTHKKTIVIMAGGTGGHVYPALSVASRLADSNFNITWIGTINGIENKIVPNNHFTMHMLKMAGYSKTKMMNKVRSIILLIRNVFSTAFLFIKKRPCCVVGFGGYISLPGAISAKLLFVPIVLHEQNSKPGLANKLIHLFSSKTLTAFEGVLDSRKTIYTGNPVRNEICELKNLDKQNREIISILIMGGSLGARFINKTIPELLVKFKFDLPVEVIHQAGNVDISEIQKIYNDAAMNCTVLPYIDNVVDAYKKADLVICRSGAMTVSELMCAAIPAIYIPYPYAIYDHQYYNAEYVVKNHGGFVVRQDEYAEENIKKILINMTRNTAETLSQLRSNLKKLNYESGTDLIAQQCREYC